MILAGYIDAPESIFWIVSRERDSNDKGRLGQVTANSILKSENYSSLAKMLAEFITHEAQGIPIYSVVFSVPGPVLEKGMLADIQRPAWARTRAEEIAKTLPAEVPVLFLNDMEAIGYGIFSIKEEDRQHRINELNASGSSETFLGAEDTSIALLTVGSGFGQAFWSWNAKKNEFSVFPSEGGHADFAPRSDIEMELYKFLKKRNEGDAVSYEQVLSANGIRTIYEFLANREVRKEMGPLPSVHEIIRRSNERADALAVNAVDLFSAVLGAEAGNAALQYLPAGGVYLAGGLIPEMLPSLKRDNIFMDAFSFKEGVFSKYNAEISVRVVDDDKLPLWGAAARGLPLLTRGYWVYRRMVGMPAEIH
jgi:glucokinase